MDGTPKDMFIEVQHSSSKYFKNLYFTNIDRVLTMRAQIHTTMRLSQSIGNKWKILMRF